MRPEAIAEIRARSEAELERREAQEGFPALPPVPAPRYGDPDFFALEMRHVFDRSWLFAAHEDELREPGAAVAIDHLSAPILLLRGADGEVRAFFNACRHRGARLLAEGAGRLEGSLRCPYHGWTYDLGGKLRGVPDEYDFPGLDKSCRGLRPVRCESWAGFVFVNFDPDAVALREGLAPVVADLDDQIGDAAPGTDAYVLRKTTIEIPVNWKLATDANLETYHVDTLHRDTAAGAIDPRSTTIRLLAQGHSSMYLQARGDTPSLPLPSFPHVCDLAGEGVWTYSLFPNVVLTFSRQMMFTVTSWPIGPDRTRYDLCFIGAAPIDEETAAFWQLFLDFNEQVIAEDVTALAGMQGSIDAGALESVPLSYQERRIYHLHEELDRRIGEEVPAELRVEPVLTRFTESGA